MGRSFNYVHAKKTKLAEELADSLRVTFNNESLFVTHEVIKNIQGDFDIGLTIWNGDNPYYFPDEELVLFAQQQLKISAPWATPLISLGSI